MSSAVPLLPDLPETAKVWSRSKEQSSGEEAVMGGLNRTGINTAHDAALLAAEAARQSSLAANPTPTQVQMDAIELTFHRAIVASCRLNNNSHGLEASMRALQDLGQFS